MKSEIIANECESAIEVFSILFSFHFFSSPSLYYFYAIYTKGDRRAKKLTWNKHQQFPVVKKQWRKKITCKHSVQSEHDRKNRFFLKRKKNNFSEKFILYSGNRNVISQSQTELFFFLSFDSCCLLFFFCASQFSQMCLYVPYYVDRSSCVSRCIFA